MESIDSGWPTILSLQSPNQSHLNINMTPSLELTSANRPFFDLS